MERVEFGGVGVFEAADFPTGVDHVFDEVGFELVLRLEDAVVEGGEELEVLHGFGFKDGAGGVHAMGGVVDGGAGFAFGGDGAVGFCAVDPGLFGTGWFIVLHDVNAASFRISLAGAGNRRVYRAVWWVGGGKWMVGKGLMGS
jgi:hypothetical protein